MAEPPEPDATAVTRREQLRGLVPAELVAVDLQLTVGWYGASRLVMARQLLEPHLKEAGYQLVAERRDELEYARDVRTARGVLVRLLAGPAGAVLGDTTRATVAIRADSTSDAVRVVGQAPRALAVTIATLAAPA